MAKLFWQNELFEAAFESAGLDSLDALCGDGPLQHGKVITTARTRRLVRIELPYQIPGSEQEPLLVRFFVKTQIVPAFGLPPRKWVSYFLRGCPIAREGHTSRRLQGLNVQTPLLVAAGARGHFPGTVKAVIVTRELDTHVDLEHYLTHESDDAKRAETAESAHALLGALHKRGYALGGARYRNFLVPKTGTASIFEVAVIDQPDFARAPHRRARDRRHMSLDHGRFFPTAPPAGGA